MDAADRTTLDLVKRLSEVGIALSAEKDERRLMELILRSAKDLTNADGGTLYSRTEDNKLKFEIMLTDSLDIRLGGTSGQPIDLPNVPLFNESGEPNEKMVAAKAAVSGETVNIPNAYDEGDFDFSGTRAFDQRTGYRSTSFLTVPMRSHEDEVIGVLQLINALPDGTDGAIVPFSPQDQHLVESLTSQAAIALTNKRLLDQQRVLFESFIELMAGAIDDKSPYTGGHCRRVPELTLMLADAAAATGGPLEEFQMDENDRYELQIAGWLHDCGKVTTPEYVVDKSTKLETIFDRIKVLDVRFEVLKRDAEIDLLKQLAALAGDPVLASEEELNAQYAARIEEIDADREFLRRANLGGEFMSQENKDNVARIAERQWRGETGELQPFLTEEEVCNLQIERGTLTPEEREIINHHIVATIKMLESLPYPKHLRRVPEFAGGHHERMDGKGYPRGLKRDEMSVQARAMGIADIFEALTAGDRPYKKAMTLSTALTILGRMKEDNHVDPDLFDVFIRQGVYLRYAETFLEPSQIDDVDLSSIPGYIP